MRRSKIAADLRAEQLRDTRGRSAEQNMAEALRLGEEAIRLLQEGQGIGRAEARRRIERTRQAGRRPSAAAR